MNKIEVKVLNPTAIAESEKMMVCCARLTQRGHSIHNMKDFEELYNKSYTSKTINAMSNLPHPTIQKFGVINIAIVGASRRFLAQITRHQNEVKFMSASLQYSDYSDNTNSDNFVVPYDILIKDKKAKEEYLNNCSEAMKQYKALVDSNINNDSAGYVAPQSLRNILIISATPYQWKHMISQRTCRRNTDETRYIMLLIWDKLYDLSPQLFGNCGPFCMHGPCKEGKMCCGHPIDDFIFGPSEIIVDDYIKILEAGD